MLHLFLLMMLGTRSVSVAPADAVRAFATAYVKQQHAGLLDTRAAKRTLSPFLSGSLRKHMEDLRKCRSDWERQQPKGTTDKPPLVDCCFFSSMPDGVPTSFSIGKSETLPDGRSRVIVDFTLAFQGMDELHWQDAMIVTRENDRYVIDDVLYDVRDSDRRDNGHLAAEYEGCDGPRWVER
jgi:hypothetical protein